MLAVAVLPAKAAVDGAPRTSEISLLQNAYVLLSQANHDYDGHRVKAMQSIHKAALLLQSESPVEGRRSRGPGHVGLRSSKRLKSC